MWKIECPALTNQFIGMECCNMAHRGWMALDMSINVRSDPIIPCVTHLLRPSVIRARIIITRIRATTKWMVFLVRSSWKMWKNMIQMATCTTVTKRIILFWSPIGITNTLKIKVFAQKLDQQWGKFLTKNSLSCREQLVPGLQNISQLPVSILMNGAGVYRDPQTNSIRRVPLPVFRMHPRRCRSQRFRVINSDSSVCPMQLQVSRFCETIHIDDVTIRL